MSAKIVYVKGRGRAESWRLMMAAGGVEWTEGPDYIDTPEDLAKVRASGHLPFDQLPLLHIDGLHLVQTGAALRYLAHRCGMLGGTDPKTIVMVDVYAEGARDFVQPFLGKSFMPPEMFAGAIKGAADKYLPFFERILSKSESPNHLYGKTTTMADIALLEALLCVEEEIPGGFDKFPKLKAYLHEMKKQPRIATYLASTKRFPPNSPDFGAKARKIFNF